MKYLLFFLVSFFVIYCKGQGIEQMWIEDSIIVKSKDSKVKNGKSKDTSEKKNIFEDFTHVKDDFYPQNNRYDLIRESRIGYDFFSMTTKSLLPRIYEDGRLKLIMNYEGGSWMFINRIVIKADSLYELEVKNDCLQETLPYSQYGPSIREACFFDIKYLDFKTITLYSSEVKIRLYGKDGYVEIKHHPKEWNKCLKLYESLNKID